jgi:DNA-binding MarR family transcriptional regulator
MTGGEPSPTPGALVWRLAMKWRAAVDRAVAPLGLTHAQYSLLGSLSRMVRDGRRPSQRELADYAGLETIYVSKLARTLEQSGFIVRAGNPTDTRAVQLDLTPVGRKKIEQALAVVRDLMEELTEPIGGTTSDQARAFTETLHTLLDA